MPDNNGTVQSQRLFDFGGLLQSIRIGNIQKSQPLVPMFAFLRMAKDHFINKEELKIINDPVNKGKKILTYKELPICEQEVATIDFCNVGNLESNLENTVKPYYIALDGLKTFTTKEIILTQDSWEEFKTVGGEEALKKAISKRMAADWQHVFMKIEKWFADLVFEHRGCYPDDSNTPKSINMFFTEANGQRTLNSQAFDDIEIADKLDENPAPYKIKIGGSLLAEHTKKILDRTVPNTAVGIDQRAGVAERIRQTYTTNIIRKIGDDGAEKFFNIDPRAIKFINYVDVNLMSSETGIVPTMDKREDESAWNEHILNAEMVFRKGAIDQYYDFIYFDDVFGFRWKGKVSVKQCDGKFQFVLQFSTKFGADFTNKGDLSCTNRCATGIEVYNVCVPEPQPSCAPTTMPVLPPSLCAYVTMPTPCNYQIAKGDTLSLDFGGMTYEYVMPYTLVFEDTDSVLANIQSMFGNYIEKGRFVQDGGTKQWLYIEPFQSGTTSNALTVGTGKISASCFAAEIGFELRNCDAAVTRKIETRGVEQPTKADPASFINTALAKSTVTATKTTVTSTKANPSK